MSPSPVKLPVERPDVFDLPVDMEQITQEQPLCRLAYPDGHIGWLVSSYALAREVLGDTRFSSRSDLARRPTSTLAADGVARPSTRPGFFIGMDPPDHTRYRKLLARYFTVRRVEDLRPTIERIVQGLIDVMEQAGPPVDFVRTFALPLPSLVVGELIGVPYAEREVFQRRDKIRTETQSMSFFKAEIDFMRALVRNKRLQPGDDLVSTLVGSGELTDEEVAGVAALLVNAGHHTTKQTLALGVLALLRHPSQLESLRADPKTARKAVEELLRYLTVTSSHTRTAVEDVDLHGQLVKAGESVTISLYAANRDPQAADAPEQLDVNRTASRHLAFGYGIHKCLGQHLARLELQIAYLALFHRFPSLRVAEAPDSVVLRVENFGRYEVDQLLVTW